MNAIAPRLAGTGHYFPGSPVTNAELLGRHPGMGIDPAWIVERTGVSSRHWPGQGEFHVDMAQRAALQALATAGVRADEVDVIIATSATVRPSTNPSTGGNRYMDIALPLQGRLGCDNAFAFDIDGTACAGFLYASAVARGLLTDPSRRNVLVVCAENPEPILNFRYRNSVLFGGGAAAAVWSAGDEPSAPGGLESVALRSDPQHYDAFDIDDEGKMIMKGDVVSDLAPQALAEVTTTLMDECELTWDDIDWVIPHQGNIRIIDAFQSALQVPQDKVLVNIRRRGNTSSVSVPGCLSEHVEEGTIRPGDRVLTMSIGRGFTWGAMLFTIDAGATNPRGRSSVDQEVA